MEIYIEFSNCRDTMNLKIYAKEVFSYGKSSNCRLW